MARTASRGREADPDVNPRDLLPELAKIVEPNLSNFRMVESKSGRTFNEINEYSEKSAEFGPKGINRLADDSE
jgi:hypothetical protein